MSINIRRARLDELEIIQKLDEKVFKNDFRHDPYLVMDWPWDPSTGGKYFKSRLEGEGIVLVAENEDGVVGYLAGAMQPNESYRRGRRSELENMFVHPTVRRLGVGSQLIQAFVEWSREQGADEIFVSAYFDNSDAVSFYKHNNFRFYSHSLLLDLRSS